MSSPDAAGALTHVLTMACRRAAKLGHAEVGTEHALHALLDNGSPAAILLAPGIRASGALMGLISAKGIGPSWLSADTADSEPGSAALAVLREAAGRAVRKPGDTPAPGPSGALLAAVAQALREAGDRDLAWATETHLLIGLLCQPDNRATEALLERRIDPEDLVTQLREHPTCGQDGEPDLGPITTLRRLGALTERSTLGGRLLNRLTGEQPVAAVLRLEAERQQTRLGHPVLTSRHLLLAILSLDELLTATGATLTPEFAACCTAAADLRARGVTWPNARATAAATPDRETEPTRAVDQARLHAARTKAPHLGTTHLLAVLEADPDSSAAALLRALA